MDVATRISHVRLMISYSVVMSLMLPGEVRRVVTGATPEVAWCLDTAAWMYTVRLMNGSQACTHFESSLCTPLRNPTLPRRAALRNTG